MLGQNVYFCGMDMIAHAQAYWAQVQAAATYIKEHFDHVPQVGIILGTGLGGLMDDVEELQSLEYRHIPHFTLSTVESHSGRLVLARLHGKYIAIMQGRFHYYEGYNMQQVTFPVRVLKELGIERLLISNAAGGLDPAHKVSDLMLIEDHINLMPANPLTGAHIAPFGVRFPDMSDPYDEECIETALEIARVHKLNVHRGVYVAVPGPNLETKAEYRYLRTIGADAVGMSTVPENIVARQLGLPVFAVSVITDLCTPGNIKKVQIEHVLEAAKNAEPALRKLTGQLIASF